MVVPRMMPLRSAALSLRICNPGAAAPSLPRSQANLGKLRRH
jgi:hypothetical protein